MLNQGEAYTMDGREGPGRPPHQATEQSKRFVRAMASVKRPLQEIADVVGVSPNTLRACGRLVFVALIMTTPVPVISIVKPDRGVFG
jgi:hypothetical protein